MSNINANITLTIWFTFSLHILEDLSIQSGGSLPNVRLLGSHNEEISFLTEFCESANCDLGLPRKLRWSVIMIMNRRMAEL